MSYEDEVPAGASLRTGTADWTVFFNTRTHQFRASAPGMTDVHSKNWDGLEAQCKVKASQAKVKVAIPYAWISWKGVAGSSHAVLKQGMATGIHASTGAVLAREDGKATQVTSSTSYFKPPTEEDGKRLLELAEQVRALEIERRTILRRYEFRNGLQWVVRDAVKLAQAARDSAGSGTEETGDELC